MIGQIKVANSLGSSLLGQQQLTQALPLPFPLAPIIKLKSINNSVADAE
jgi:hypothetical protein